MWRVLTHSLRQASKLTKTNYPCVVQVVGYKQHEKALRKELYRRRLEVGPEPWRHRSEYPNWNYEAEIFGFGKRMNLALSENTLKKVFIHGSYVQEEVNRRDGLGINDGNLQLESNDSFIAIGEVKGYQCVENFLRHIYPYLPDEQVSTLCRYLLSDDSLSFIGQRIGIVDLIKSKDLPPLKHTIALTMKSLLGALDVECSGSELELFVKYLVIPQLIGKDIATLLDIQNPMGVLAAILKNRGQAPPEPRLMWQSGSNTVLAIYHVGIYSDKILIGKSPGETVSIAEEEAAREALKKIFQIEDNRPPLPIDLRTYSNQ